MIEQKTEINKNKNKYYIKKKIIIKIQKTRRYKTQKKQKVQMRKIKR